MPGPRAIDLGLATHPGQVRELNEDTLGSPAEAGISASLRLERGELLAVADGMGGHAAGEVASQLAITTLYSRYYYDPSPDLTTSLRLAVELANADVHSRACSGLATHGMGTTLVAAVVKGSHLIVANVGDSRAYLVRRGQMRQISRDHSWVAESMDAGLLTEEQARTHRYRNLVTRALGQKPEVEVDLFQERLRSGDTVVLCSDGLTGEVGETEIADTVNRLPVSKAAPELVALANRSGGRDNVSVVVARVPGRASWLSGPILAAAAVVGLSICLVALGLLTGAFSGFPWQRAAQTATPVSVVADGTGTPSLTGAWAETTGMPAATGTAAAAPHMIRPEEGGTTTTVSPIPEVTPSAVIPRRVGSTPLPAMTRPPSDVPPLPAAPLGPIIQVPLRWGCHHVERCETGQDALTGLLASFGYGSGDLQLKLQELSGGLVLDLAQRVEANLAKPPVECVLGVAGELTVHTQQQGQFLNGELRVETGDAGEILVTVTRSDLGLPCQPAPVLGEEVVVCGQRAQPALGESRLLARLVVSWPEVGQPEIWLPLDEPISWISGDATTLKWIGLLPGDLLPEGSSGEAGTDPWLVYAQPDQSADRCQLSLHPAEFEAGSPALFVWDSAHSRFVCSEK